MAAEDRLHGSHGMVKMDPTGGATAVAVAGLDKWELDMAKDHVRVTAFGDSNHVYVDGLPDIKGSYGGWFDPVDGLDVFAVIFGTAKPYLELYPNDADTATKWSGKALIDGKITVDANGGVAVSGSFVGAGPWDFPTALPLGRRVSSGEGRRA
jgi:hypothetical protein